ncbi:uncharacterized protein LOC141907810 [Tubulanus polymorphus]|uniref:uncharacterized protein LOC141907810 n=1 Tax=Tubulanus polymorphus TaxID=672921 RepID=UPI003DA69765
MYHGFRKGIKRHLPATLLPPDRFKVERKFNDSGDTSLGFFFIAITHVGRLVDEWPWVFEFEPLSSTSFHFVFSLEIIWSSNSAPYSKFCCRSIFSSVYFNSHCLNSDSCSCRHFVVARFLVDFYNFKMSQHSGGSLGSKVGAGGKKRRFGQKRRNCESKFHEKLLLTF